MDFPPASSVLRIIVGLRLVGVIVPDEICCMAAMSMRSLPRISHFPSLPQPHGPGTASRARSHQQYPLLQEPSQIQWGPGEYTTYWILSKYREKTLWEIGWILLESKLIIYVMDTSVIADCICYQIY